MLISNLSASLNNGNIRLSVSIESERIGFKELWFSVPVKFEKYLCKSRMDGFLVGMLFPAMQYAENIHINGCVSEKLLFNLNNYVVPLLLSFSPSCKKIKITATETCSESFDTHGVGTGFSGGVDSFCTIYDRFELECSPKYKINSVLFLNVGSHGGVEQEGDLEFARRKFLRRYNYLKKFPDELGLDFIPLDSNLHVFHPWWYNKTHTLASAAGVLILQGFYSKYYYASPGYDYGESIANAKRYKDVDIGIYCDPILLPLLSTESLEIIPDGHSYTRVQKTLHIINYEPVGRYLNVCISTEDTSENCSVCDKCCRTLMTLNSVGQLEKFKGVFNIDKYKKRSERIYACEQVVLKNENCYSCQNVVLAQQKGIKLPNIAVAYTVHTFKKLLKSVFSPSVIQKIKNTMEKL